MMPFPGGLSATANGLVLFSAIAAILYGVMLHRPVSWRRTAAKTLAVFLLALAAWERDGPLLLVAALLLGALGDAFLAHDGEKAFLGGLASFLAAHLAYVVLFWSTGDGLAGALDNPRKIVLAVMIAVLCVALLRKMWPGVPGELRIPVVAYVAAILAMAFTALTHHHPAVILGASLFVVSDAILAAEKFLFAPDAPQRAWSGYAVWTLYYVAQLMIALGILGAY